MRKKSSSASYGVIGLGRFGTALAVTLAKSGREVIVVDRDEGKIKEMRQYTDYAFVSENLSIETLREVGIQNCDVVIVCIGEKVDVSILTTIEVKPDYRFKGSDIIVVIGKADNIDEFENAI
ncbi:MAG: NAD-binding protein [Lachnospiraceae bacterium]|jgi:trk system potassium uptake protein TrkA|nr:NAD-binding protein [Lachnospiraceae bacterium]